MPSDITMKNLVPPIAHNNPKETAMCIQSFRFSGTFCAMMPEISKGIPSRDGKKEVMEFDDEIIERRSRSIGYAIEARKQKYPNEEAYKYYPFEQSGKSFVWNDNSREDLKDYNLEDLSI